MSWTAKEFFEQKFAKKIQEDPAFMASAGVRGQSIGVSLDGFNGGEWTFEFDSNGSVVMKTGGAAQATCMIQTSDKIFEGMITGSVNVPMAFITRKIKVKGESQLAVKLGLALQKAFIQKT